MEELAKAVIAVEDHGQHIEQDSQGIRIIDRCRHFLGKMMEGNVYIYCGKCKKFVMVHKH